MPRRARAIRHAQDMARSTTSSASGRAIIQNARIRPALLHGTEACSRLSEGLRDARGRALRMWCRRRSAAVPDRRRPFRRRRHSGFKVRLLRIERGAAAMQRQMMQQMQQQQGGAGAGPEAGGPQGREGAGGRGEDAPPPPEGNRQR